MTIHLVYMVYLETYCLMFTYNGLSKNAVLYRDDVYPLHALINIPSWVDMIRWHSNQWILLKKSLEIPDLSLINCSKGGSIGTFTICNMFFCIELNGHTMIRSQLLKYVVIIITFNVTWIEMCEGDKRISCTITIIF